jgi:integrase/recombinase XerD
MTLPRISIKHLKHRNDDQIGLYFQYNSQLISHVKAIEGMRWSQSNRCWYIRNNPDNLRKIFSSLRGHAVIEKGDFFGNKPTDRLSKTTTKSVAQASNQIPDEYQNLLKRRRYSENTIKIYQHYFYQFINHFPGLSIGDLTENHIRKFQDYLVNKKKVSLSTQNQAINAIKFYFERVLGGERKTYYVERPRREKKLPDVLTKEEVGLMIQLTTNLKHKCLIAIIYSCGLRRSEALNIKLHHIDTGRKISRLSVRKVRKTVIYN